VRWAIVCEIIVCFTLYSIAATFGYLSFLDNTKGNIADSYGSGWTNAIFRIIFAIAVICAFPMCCYPCRLSLDGLIMEFYHGLRKILGYTDSITTVPSAYESLVEKDLSFWKRIEKKLYNPESIESIRSIIETLVIGYGSFLLAVFFPKIEIVFSLTGSTASAFTAIIFPAWFFIKLSGLKWFDVRIIFAILVLAFGIFFGIFGTGVTVYGLFVK
jgi:amino acid permease